MIFRILSGILTLKKKKKNDPLSTFYFFLDFPCGSQYMGPGTHLEPQNGFLGEVKKKKKKDHILLLYNILQHSLTIVLIINIKAELLRPSIRLQLYRTLFTYLLFAKKKKIVL